MKYLLIWNCKTISKVWAVMQTDPYHSHAHCEDAKALRPVAFACDSSTLFVATYDYYYHYQSYYHY